jgi:hypothetical protein
MIDALLFVLVTGAVVLALAVDAAVLLGWVKNLFRNVTK